MFSSIVGNFPKLKKSNRRYTTQVNRAYGPVSDPPRVDRQQNPSPKPRVQGGFRNKNEEEPCFAPGIQPRQVPNHVRPQEERPIEPGYPGNFLHFPEERPIEPGYPGNFLHFPEEGKGEKPAFGKNESNIERPKGGNRPNAEPESFYKRHQHQEEPFHEEFRRNEASIISDIVDCKFETCDLIEKNALHFDIQRAFHGCKISFDTEAIVIQAMCTDLPEVKLRVEDLVKRFTFDENAKWMYLENHGFYKEYPQEQNRMIESEYKRNFHKLISPTYENYSERLKLKHLGADYFIEFARIEGVHRQIRLQASGTIRAVKRQADGENLNKGFRRTFQWYWEDEDGYICEYKDEANFLIEQSYIEYKTKGFKSIVLFQGVNGSTYTINFDEMFQSNEISQHKRKVIREDIA